MGRTLFLSLCHTDMVPRSQKQKPEAKSQKPQPKTQKTKARSGEPKVKYARSQKPQAKSVWRGVCTGWVRDGDGCKRGCHTSLRCKELCDTSGRGAACERSSAQHSCTWNRAAQARHFVFTEKPCVDIVKDQSHYSPSQFVESIELAWISFDSFFECLSTSMCHPVRPLG
jgi:hypothetical protein